MDQESPRIRWKRLWVVPIFAWGVFCAVYGFLALFHAGGVC